MRNPRVQNKYNLTFKDLKKLKIEDRTKIRIPLFWRNTVINAWCISETTTRTKADNEFGTYNEYIIIIHDENSKRKNKIEVDCSSHGGMCNYTFEQFFDYKEIENEMDLDIQEKLLSKINILLDEGILKMEGK